MARRSVSRRQKYVMWQEWKRLATIKELSERYGLSKNKVKRVLRKFRKAHDTGQYSKTIAKFANKNGITWEAELKYRAEVTSRRHKKSRELGIWHGAEPQNFLGIDNHRRWKWRY